MVRHQLASAVAHQKGTQQQQPQRKPFLLFLYSGIEGAFYEPGSKTVIPRKVRMCCFCACLRYSNQVVNTWLTASGKN